MTPLTIEEPVRLMTCSHDRVETHTHDFLELVYVLTGCARQTVNGAEAEIRRGDFFFLNYGAFHSYERIGSETFSIVNCLFTPVFIDASLLGCRDFGEILDHYLIKFGSDTIRRRSSNHVFHDEDGEIRSCIMRMVREYDDRERGYAELIRCELIGLIIRAMRMLEDAPYGVESKICREIVGEIQSRYDSRLTLSDYVSEFNYSLPCLSKKFQSEMGMTFSEYLQRTRIRRSCILLANTDRPVSEIAELVGYADVGFFGRIFRRQMHISPTQFRRQARTV